MFLVTVRGADVSVHQLRAGPGGVFEDRPDLPKVAAEVTALRKTNPQVRRFWAGEDPDAEDRD